MQKLNPVEEKSQNFLFWGDFTIVSPIFYASIKKIYFIAFVPHINFN